MTIYFPPNPYVDQVTVSAGRTWRFDGKRWTTVGDVGFQGSLGFQGSSGATGYQGSTGVTGYIGSQGYTGSVGYTGSNGFAGSRGLQGFPGDLGPQGDQGTIGYTGSSGFTGSQGELGDKGYVGSRGFQGDYGGIAFDYMFSSTAAPGTVGNIYINPSNQLQIDQYDINNTLLYSFLNTIADSTSSIKGHFTITSKANNANFALYSLTSTSFYDSGTGVFYININYLSGPGTFTDGTEVIIVFDRTGDKGDKGDTGYKGSQGVVGYVGSQGVVGYTGSLGRTNGFRFIGMAGAGSSQFSGWRYADPNHLQFNNSDPTLVTHIELNQLDLFNVFVPNILINLVNNVSNLIKGQLYISSITNGAVLVYNVIDNTHYVSIASQQYVYSFTPLTVQYVSGDYNGIFDNTPVDVVFVPTSSMGYSGSAGVGYTGSQSNVIGYSGSQGYWGSHGVGGYAGSQGVLGYVGSQGYFGSQGYWGSVGVGYTGSKGDTGLGQIKTTIGSSVPTGSSPGDLWIDDTTGIEYMYVNDSGSYEWIEFGNLGVRGQIGYNGSQGAGYTGSAGAGYTGSRGVQGTSGVARATVSGTTTSLANLATGNISVTGYKSYVLFKIQTSCEAWVRIYTDSTSRSSDSSRTIGTDPTPGSGVIAEILTTTGYLTQLITPGIFGFNNDGTPTTNIYLAVTNYNASSQAVTVTLTVIQMEL